MCGIFGFVGQKADAANIILSGLKRLEYRGYDSWGIAVLSQSGESKVKESKIVVAKKVGAIGDVTSLSLPESRIGIGHTRWATHGGVVESNAHPHASSDDKFVLAQNGIVENYLELKEKLASKGHTFKTDTDTEVIVRLIEEELKTNNEMADAVREAVKKLKGRNTIIVLTSDGEIVAARNGSPLVVGKNDGGDYYFSSDTLSFANEASEMLVVDNGQMVVFKDGDLTLRAFESGEEIAHTFEKLTFESENVDREGHEHFMIKEIHEAPYVIRQLISQDSGDYPKFIEAILKAKQVYTMGSGTAGIAAAQIAYYLRAFAKINAISLIGADAYDCYDLFGEGDLIITPSQSGETADVLEVLELAKKKGVKIASYVNMPGSMITKLSDFKFMAQAGAEICVMSTKVFVSQLAWGYLIAKMAQDKKEEGIENLKMLAEKIEKYLAQDEVHKEIKDLARQFASVHDIFLLGKGQNFQIIKEGMVKIIEGSYKHAHAVPAGDLKHYAITLMEKGVPVVVAVSEDEVKSDVLNAISQVKARGADVIGISPEKEEVFDVWLAVPDTGETSAIVNIIPLQLLAYYMAVELGNNVDRPRNIAKSVTVK